jgi:hypothetical protein
VTRGLLREGLQRKSFLWPQEEVFFMATQKDCSGKPDPIKQKMLRENARHFSALWGHAQIYIEHGNVKLFFK